MPAFIVNFAHRSKRTWRFHALLFAICVIGFAIRLWFCIEVNGHPFVTSPPDVTDMATYRELAQQILRGDFPERFYYQPLYYSLFLPAIFAAAGPGGFAVAIVQCFVATAAIWLVGAVGAHLFGRRAGLFAAGLLALSRFHVFYTPFALMTILLSFFVIAMTAVVLSAWKHDKLWLWGLAGLITGLAILTRGNMLLLVPGVLVLIVWRNRERMPRAGVAVVLFLVLMYLPQLPFAWKNYQSAGRWTGPSTAADAVLALGNTPESPPGIPGATYYPPTYKAWMKDATRDDDQRVSVLQRIGEWFRREPLAFLELKFRMALLFWYHWEIPNNIFIGQVNNISRVIGSSWLLDFTIIGTLGVAGMLTWIKRSRRSPQRLYLYWSVVAFWAATVAFYILARFRVPVVPLVCVFGGGFIEYALHLVWHRGPWNRRRRLALAATVASLGVAAFIVAGGYSFYQRYLEAPVLRLARPHGVVAELDGVRHHFDHGPRVMGGWTLVKIPRDGLRVQKAFNVPAQLAASERVLTALRFPVVAPGGGQLVATAYVGHVRAGARTFDLQADQREIQWLEIPVREMRLQKEGALATNIICRYRAPQPVFTVVDRFRDYGRTTLVDIDGTPVQATGEVAVETVWATGGAAN